MKCSGCGEKFPNLNALTRHKSECPANKNVTVLSNEGSSINIGDVGIKITGDEVIYGSGKCIIPLAMCPEEIKYYALGKTVGMRVEGKYTTEGIEVQEVALIR